MSLRIICRSQDSSEVTQMASEESNARDKWGSKRQFLLACIGNVVGKDVVWRFLYSFYRHGGGAFLIPYFITLIFFCVPFLYMEMAVGQLTRLGPVHALAKLCPLLKGTGVAMVMQSLMLATYFSEIIAWALHYLFHSFTNPLPWQTCGNLWNTDACNETAESNVDSTYQHINIPLKRESPISQYYTNFVRQMLSGFGDFGGLNGEMVGYLFLAWFICYCGVFKGVKSIGKVVYVTVILPYAILIILLVRTVTLPGAVDGIYYFLKPDWNKLRDIEVWMHAMYHNIYSMGIRVGSLIAFSSYNRKTNNIYHDTLVITIINSLTHLLGGFIAFSCLGFIAHTQGTSVENLAYLDFEFVAMPTLFAYLPISNLWAILFFVMVIFLGVDTQFGYVEVITTSILDHFHHKLKNIKRRREIVAFFVCFICFLLSLPHACQDGNLFHLVDVYVSFVIVAYFEVMAICWIYGANRLAREISFLSGYRPYYFFPFCWFFISPVLLKVMSIFVLKYFSTHGVPVQYRYNELPAWVHVIGVSVLLIWIPLGIIHSLYTARGRCTQRFGKAVTPTFVPNHMKKSNSRDEEVGQAASGMTVRYTPAAVSEPLLIVY